MVFHVNAYVFILQVAYGYFCEPEGFGIEPDVLHGNGFNAFIFSELFFEVAALGNREFVLSAVNASPELAVVVKREVVAQDQRLQEVKIN